MLVAVYSCDVSAYKARFIHITLMIGPTKAQVSSINLCDECLLKMSDDVCVCGGQIVKVTSNTCTL